MVDCPRLSAGLLIKEDPHVLHTPTRIHTHGGPPTRIKDMKGFYSSLQARGFTRHLLGLWFTAR